MMAVERQRKIVEYINVHGSIRVAEISQLFDVTPETARRDLDLLESEGKLRRSHGGAVRVLDDLNDVPYLERENTNAKEKSEIAKLAAALIHPGDTIALDASSTSWFLARALPDISATVLTNSIRVAQELSQKSKITVISTGGILRAASMSFVGPLAQETLSKYHVQKAFVSCKGIHPQYGVTESSELQALIKGQMVMIADETFLLADHTKFGKRDFAQAFPITQINAIVTDSIKEVVMEPLFVEAGILILR